MLGADLARGLKKGSLQEENDMLTTTTTAPATITRLDEIVQRERRSRLRQRVFIAAVAVIALVTFGSIALAATPPALTPAAMAAPSAADAT